MLQVYPRFTRFKETLHGITSDPQYKDGYVDRNPYFLSQNNDWCKSYNLIIGGSLYITCAFPLRVG